MTTTTSSPDCRRTGLMELIRAIASRDVRGASLLLATTPGLALEAAVSGAGRKQASHYFFPEIGHYVYAGDSALHIAAAAYQLQIADELMANGANPRARNRRGAEPLHYASDGGPGSATWDPAAPEAIVEYLIKVGGDPNSADKNGVMPLHRAVRTRCAAAVRALLANGAAPRCPNHSGSTPLHLAVQNTGRGGSGLAESKEQQKKIIFLLLKYGARPADKDGHGKPVQQSASTAWVLELLEAPEWRPGYSSCGSLK